MWWNGCKRFKHLVLDSFLLLINYSIQHLFHWYRLHFQAINWKVIFKRKWWQIRTQYYYIRTCNSKWCSYYSSDVVTTHLVTLEERNDNSNIIHRLLLSSFLRSKFVAHVLWVFLPLVILPVTGRILGICIAQQNLE